jgi:hypothetical protein
MILYNNVKILETDLEREYFTIHSLSAYSGKTTVRSLIKTETTTIPM